MYVKQSHHYQLRLFRIHWQIAKIIGREINDGGFQCSIKLWTAEHEAACWARHLTEFRLSKPLIVASWSLLSAFHHSVISKFLKPSKPSIYLVAFSNMNYLSQKRSMTVGSFQYNGQITDLPNTERVLVSLTALWYLDTCVIYRMSTNFFFFFGIDHRLQILSVK